MTAVSALRLFQHHIGIQQVRDHHERRMEKLEELIEERRQMVEDHNSGHRKLSDEEYERASRQHDNFQRKLEQMQASNHDVSLVRRYSLVGICKLALATICIVY